MSIEPIGLITFLFCLAGFIYGPRYSLSVLIQFSLLGSAAAALIGATTVQPAHLSLIILLLVASCSRKILSKAVLQLRPTEPGFWLAVMIIYGIIGGFFFPRLFSGKTVIIPIGNSAYDDTGSYVPISPVSGNFTQPIYLCLDLICFCLVAAITSERKSAIFAAKSILLYSLLNICFAFVDLITYNTGTQDYLYFIRNSQYAFHLDEEASGLKRIAGSFTEASAFAQATLGSFAFTASLWILGIGNWFVASIAATSLILIVISTSSTGLVALLPAMGILYVTAMVNSFKQMSSRSVLIVAGVPALAPIAAIYILINDQLWLTIYDYINALVLNKATTQSGLERATWNVLAIDNFTSTWGLGVGLGTARASSFVTAMLSNLGVPGLATYIIFVLLALFRGMDTADTPLATIHISARNAALTVLTAQCVSGALVDQGLIFYVFVALASATSFSAKLPH